MTLNARQDSGFYIAVEQTADAICITSTNGIIEYVNPAFEKVTGFSKSEAIGQTPSIIKSGLQSPQFYKRLWRTILAGKTFRGTFHNRAKNGKLFYVDHTITPIKQKNGRIIKFMGIWKDISAQQELEKRKDEFIAIASHELRTPLTSAKLLAQLAKTQLNADRTSRIPEYLGKIETQLDRMTLLISEMLDMSKIKSGKLELHQSYVQISDLLSENIENYRLAASRHRIELSTQKCRPVLADHNRVSQVIANLLSNAIKYSPENSLVSIKTESTSSYIKVSITDQGEGIPKNEQQKIFDSFYQVGYHKHFKEPHEPNLGVGLYICSEIIKRHKGKIGVNSQPGKGSTFWFTLPLPRT